MKNYLQSITKVIFLFSLILYSSNGTQAKTTDQTSAEFKGVYGQELENGFFERDWSDLTYAHMRLLSGKGVPVIVHYSSKDPKCSFCRKSEQWVKKLHKKMKGRAIIYSINFDPWQSIKGTAPRLRGIPATDIFINKMRLDRFSGATNKELNAIPKRFDQIENILNTRYNESNVVQVEPSDLATYVKAASKDRSLILHITQSKETSTKQCPACYLNNQFYRQAADAHSNRITFAEVIFKNVNEAAKDPNIKAYFAKFKKRINGLPTSALIQSGEIKGVRGGITANLEKELRKQN